MDGVILALKGLHKSVQPPPPSPADSLPAGLWRPPAHSALTGDRRRVLGLVGTAQAACPPAAPRGTSPESWAQAGFQGLVGEDLTLVVVVMCL